MPQKGQPTFLWRKDVSLLLGTGLGALRAVLAASLVTVRNALGIQGTADDVVTHTGQVLDTAAADQNDAVLLQVMADTRNVRGDLDTIREADTGNFTQSRVRLLGGHGTHSSADAALLRAVQSGVLLLLGVVASLKSGRGALVDQDLTAFAHELVKSRHFFSPFISIFCADFRGFGGRMAALSPLVTQ